MRTQQAGELFRALRGKQLYSELIFNDIETFMAKEIF